MASYSLELDLQDPWFRPFTVHAELDRAHDGVKGRASCVCPKAGVVESPCRFDRLSNHLHLGIGAPSADVVDRIARALMLTDVEREHLFLLALGRPPEAHCQAAEGVTPRLQRVLDSLEISPAYVKTSTWDVVAWNRAAAAVLVDYGTLDPKQRNLLRLVFLDPHIRVKQPDWQGVARFAVGAFRADVARAGAAKNVAPLVDELSRESPEFAALWRDHDVRDTYEGPKRVRHPKAGVIALEYSTFAVDGRPDLSLVIYNPATPKDAEKIRSLVKPRAAVRPQRLVARPRP